MRVVALFLLLPFFSLQFPREEVLNMYSNDTRSVITYKTECWMDGNPVVYLARVQLVCAVRFEKNDAGMWVPLVLGGVVVPKEKIEKGYFACQCQPNTVVVCCPGGYCDRTLGVMKISVCGMRRLFDDVVTNSMMAETLRDRFEDQLYIEEIHGGWDDLTFLHGEDQYGNDYSRYPKQEIVVRAIFQKYAM